LFFVALGSRIRGNDEMSSPAPDQSDGLIALEQIEAHPRRPSPLPGKTAVAIQQQPRVALRDRRQFRDILG
jgi:hypothetical protein